MDSEIVVEASEIIQKQLLSEKLEVFIEHEDWAKVFDTILSFPPKSCAGVLKFVSNEFFIKRGLTYWYLRVKEALNENCTEYEVKKLFEVHVENEDFDQAWFVSNLLPENRRQKLFEEVPIPLEKLPPEKLQMFSESIKD